MAPNKTILVTGGAGFIGSYVVERLLGDGQNVLIFDHSSRKELADQKGVTVFLGDIRDEVAVTEAMSHAEGWIHLAGVLGTQETIGNPRPAVMTNIQGGLNMLEAASQYDIPGVNIAVGNHWENNPYSISKSTVERFAKMFQKERGTRVSSVRALNAYGPRQSVAAPYGNSKVRKIIPSFVMKALHGEPIQVYGDGNQVMDMIYVSDVADFLVDTLYHTTRRGGMQDTIEAGTGRPTTVLDIAKAVVQVVKAETGKVAQIEHLPLRPGETPGAVVLADKSNHSTLYSQPFDFIRLEDGLERTVHYFQEML